MSTIIAGTTVNLDVAAAAAIVADDSECRHDGHGWQLRTERGWIRIPDDAPVLLWTATGALMFDPAALAVAREVLAAAAQLPWTGGEEL